MSLPRSFRWSRQAAWPTWWARCRQALIEAGRRCAPAAPGPAGHRGCGAATSRTRVRDRAAVRRRVASRCASGACRTATCRPTSSTRRTLPPAGRPVPGQRRRRMARQPAALRAARLGRRPSGGGRARPRLDAARCCTPTTGMPRWPAPTMDAHPRGPTASSVFTVHNLAYPGPVSARRLPAARPAVAHDARARVSSSTASCRS